MTVTSDIGKLNKLETLDLSGNPIQKLPPHIGGLRCLESIDLSGCNLTELPEEFTLMTRLIEINLGNNQLQRIPAGIGRMTRLTVLNIMFNQLQDLPISIGYCVGLAKFGSGITIAQNPITNEAMLAKYQLGTDHLYDFLEKRLMDHGDYEMPHAQLPPELLDQSEREREEKERLRQAENQKNIQVKFSVLPGSPHMSRVFKQPPMQRAPDIDTELSNKMITLKNWAISAIRGDVKPKISKTSIFVAQASEAQQLMPLAQFAKNIKMEIEKAKSFLPLTPVNPHRAPPETADKLLLLKTLVQTVVDDLLYMLDIFYKKLQEPSDHKFILGVVGFVKEINREVSYLRFN